MKLSVIAILVPALVVGAPTDAETSAPAGVGKNALVNGTVGPQQSPLDCVLGAWHTYDWGEGIFWRYRVEATAQQGRSPHTQEEMIRVWCQYFNEIAPRLGFNPQCWLVNGNTAAVSDISVWVGELGLANYRDLHQQTVNAWRAWTGNTCDVNSQF